VASQDIPEADKTALMKALWLEDFLAAAATDPDEAPEMLGDAFADAQFSFRHATYAQQEAPTFDARDRLPLIEARCLVIGGTHDTMPLEKTHELHRGLANSKLAVFTESGHFAPLEEPERFKQIVFAFLGVGGAS
jgi:pimeloyl-ACP methyl ester carboxylesterase